jgi:hypothetical protein
LIVPLSRERHDQPLESAQGREPLVGCSGSLVGAPRDGPVAIGD